MKRIAAILLAVVFLAAWKMNAGNQSVRPDPRYAAVIGAQMKQRLDFLLAPSDFAHDEPELVANLLVPAISLISYSGPAKQSSEQN